MPCCASELVPADFKTELVPEPVPYAVLLPDGYKDGSQRWGTLITGPFRGFVHTAHQRQPRSEVERAMVTSMGGKGTLRIGMKHPELYAGLAALEPSSVQSS